MTLVEFTMAFGFSIFRILSSIPRTASKRLFDFHKIFSCKDFRTRQLLSLAVLPKILSLARLSV